MVGRELHWLCQDFTAPAGLQPDLPSSWEKGSAHFPRPRTQDLRLPTRGKRAQWDSCLITPRPSPPRSPGLNPEPWRGQGPASPTNGLLGWLPFHQTRSEVLGAPAWSQGLDPDQKARDWPGISREMLLAKPLGALGARQETSLPSLWLPCPRQDRPWGLESGTVQPEVSSQRTGPAWLPGSVWTSLGVPLPAVGLGFQSPAPPHSQAGGGSYRRGHGRQHQPRQELQEASEQSHGRHLLRRTKPGDSKRKPPCSSPGGAPGAGPELDGSWMPPSLLPRGPRGRPEHPLKVLEILEAPAGKADAESPAGPGGVGQAGPWEGGSGAPARSRVLSLSLVAGQ